MNSDYAIEVGNSHRVCEDYARAGSIGPVGPSFPFALVADGCSDPNSPDTDIGARLLTLAAEQSILKQSVEFEGIVKQAAVWAKAMSLHSNSLDCTLMIASMQGKFVQVDCFGDGVIAARRKDGVIEVFEIKYPAGYPYYLNYLLNPSRMASFKSVGKKIVNYFFIPPLIDSPPCNEITNTVDGKVHAMPRLTEDLMHLDTVESNDPATRMAFHVAKYDYVIITSDGIESFYVEDAKGDRTNVPITDVIKAMASFKNHQGMFVQRRFNAAMKEGRAKGWQHYDDFSVGAVYVGE